jgi:ribosome maturation factor RimP
MAGDVAQQVTALVEPLLSSLGMELVDLEYRREGRLMALRLFIDKPGGVTLDDCSAVSHELSLLLDVEDLITGAYNLEVSSPGLNRPLKRESDYLRYRGRLVKVRTFELLADEAGHRRKTFLGELVGLEDGVVVLKLREGPEARIPLSRVARANLEFEF